VTTTSWFYSKGDTMNNNNNNNTLIYIAPACRMTSEAQIEIAAETGMRLI